MRVTFDQCDSTEEIVGLFNKVFANQEQMEAKIIQNAQEIEALKSKEKPKKEQKKLPAPTQKVKVKKAEKKGKNKMKSKGSASMRVIAILMLIAALVGLGYAAYVPTDITYEIASNPELLATYLRDVTGTMISDSFLFNPRLGTNPPPLAEGRVWYDTTANSLQLSTNGTSWTAVSSAAGNSLDNAYDLGNGITVDGTAVTLTVGATDNNSALVITHGETANDNTAFLLTNSADAANAISIDIDGQTTGRDIEGTGASFYVTGAGAIVGVGVTTTGELLVTAADVLFDDTYDVAWDTDRDQLIFQDNAILGIGGAHDATADVTFKWDSANLLIESKAQDTGEIRYGSTNAIDVVHYDNAATGTGKFNANTSTLEFNAYDVQLQDDDILAFGDSDDFTVYYEETTTDNLIFKTAAANDAVQIGDGTTDTDLKMMTNTGGDFALWDSSADELYFEDTDLKLNEGAQIEFVDGTDDNTDWTIDLATIERLTFMPTETSDDQTFYIGDAAHTSDFKVFMKTAGETFTLDASADSLTFVGDLALLTLTGTTKPFYVNVTGTVAGVAHELKTTDGGIKFDADGADNGDITLEAADVLTLTSVDTKIFDGANAETWIIEGSADGFETSVVFTDPTADGTITFPDTGDEGAAGGEIAWIADAGTTTKDASDAAIPVTDAVVLGTSGGASAWSLPNGEEGQILTVVIVTDGGEAIITPDTAAGCGWATVVLTSDIDGVTFMYIDDTIGWIIIGTFSDGTNLVAVTQ